MLAWGGPWFLTVHGKWSFVCNSLMGKDVLEDYHPEILKCFCEPLVAGTTYQEEVFFIPKAVSLFQLHCFTLLILLFP